MGAGRGVGGGGAEVPNEQLPWPCVVMTVLKRKQFGFPAACSSLWMYEAHESVLRQRLQQLPKVKLARWIVAFGSEAVQ